MRLENWLLDVIYVIRFQKQFSRWLDKEIFAVFTSLKELSDSLNGFFAGGLADDKKASTAIQSAQDIEKKTTELKNLVVRLNIIIKIGNYLMSNSSDSYQKK